MDSAALAALKEERFLAGRQSLPKDTAYVLRLGRELVRSFRALASEGRCLLVTGRAPSGWNWPEALTFSRAIGTWCAAQGFGVLTLGEPGLSEALATACERAGGRALRCVLDGPSARRRVAHLALGSELARRIAVAKFARATLALSPVGESAGTLHFLHALARFERFAGHSVLLVGAGQWDPDAWDPFFSPMADGSALTTRLIDDLGELARALDFS